MSRVDLTNVHDDTEKVVYARPRQLKTFLGVLSPGPTRVREHVQLQREVDRSVNFRRPFIPSLLELKSLFAQDDQLL